MSTLELIYVGAGAMSEVVLEMAEKKPRDWKSVGFVDPNLGRAGELAARAGGKAYSNLGDALDAYPEAAVYVATPHGIHYEIGRTLLNAGRHVLMEKPMTTRTVDSRKLTELADKRKVILGVCHPRRYDETVQKLARVIKSLGGSVFATMICYRDYFLPGRKGWWLDPALSGGGILRNLGSHRVDYLISALGLPPEKVTAQVAFSAKHSGIDSDYSMTLGFSGGVVATVAQTGRLKGLNAALHRFHVLCKKGAVAIEDGGTILVARNRGPFDAVKLPGSRRSRNILDDFALAIKGKPNTLPDGRYGTLITAVLDSAYKSSTLGRGVKIRTGLDNEQ